MKRCYDLVYFFARASRALFVEQARGAFRSGKITGNEGVVKTSKKAIGRQFHRSSKRVYKYDKNYHPANVACRVGSEAFGQTGYDLIFAVKRLSPTGRTDETHPTQKPDDLMAQIVKLVSRQGDTILDPWMGSGTTGLAAIALSRDFIGIEREPEYFEMAQTNLAFIQKEMFP